MAYEDNNGTVLVKPGDGGPTRTVIAHLGNSYAATYDSAGNLFAAAANTDGLDTSYVYEVPAGGSPVLTVVNVTGYIFGVAVDSSDDVYITLVSPDNELLEFTPSGTETVIDGDLASPRGLAFDTSGNLYLADEGSSRVYEFMAAGFDGPITPTMNPKSIGYAAYTEGVAVDAYRLAYTAGQSQSD